MQALSPLAIRLSTSQYYINKPSLPRDYNHSQRYRYVLRLVIRRLMQSLRE